MLKQEKTHKILSGKNILTALLDDLKKRPLHLKASTILIQDKSTTSYICLLSTALNPQRNKPNRLKSAMRISK
ncbi:hypothetical protein HQ584_04625 [Patescibacteria group bacterium]|nr:hypothetical protein [Patescibacteria group bacterium]